MIAKLDLSLLLSGHVGFHPMRRFMTPDPVLLSDAEAAELLHMSRQTLANWRWRKKHLPYVKLGRTIRYKKSDLETFMRGFPAAQIAA